MTIYLPKEKKHLTFSVFLICLMFLFSLFALTRIKQIASPVVDMLPTTNELWIIPALLAFKKIFCDLRSDRGCNAVVLVLFAILVAVIVFGAFRATDFEQYTYAVAVFLIPILLLFVCSNKDIQYLDFFLKFFTATCFLYAIIYILLATYFRDAAAFLGDTIRARDIVSSDQYRAKMMIGTAITVANYFTLSLPILFYMFFKNKNNKWALVSFLAIAANMYATLLTLSRLGFFSSVIVALTCILTQKENLPQWGKRCLISLIAVIGFFYLADKYDIGRIFMGFSDSSTAARLESLHLALYIFTRYPVFGSGMGNYFIRVYKSNTLVVDQMSGLVDPHNAFALILSELGVVGFTLICIIICWLIWRISKIPEKMFRTTGYIIMLISAINSLGGSHLVNEISYSVVFWTYLSIFYAASFLDAEFFQKRVEIRKNKNNDKNISRYLK
jgi:O-Antigen ligase.